MKVTDVRTKDGQITRVVGRVRLFDETEPELIAVSDGEVHYFNSREVVSISEVIEQKEKDIY